MPATTLLIGLRLRLSHTSPTLSILEVVAQLFTYLDSVVSLRTFPLILPVILTPTGLPVPDLSLQATNFFFGNLILVAEELHGLKYQVVITELSRRQECQQCWSNLISGRYTAQRISIRTDPEADIRARIALK